MAQAGAQFEKRQAKELEKLLKNFGAAVAKRPVRRALREGQKVITAEAKVRAPKDEGDLKKAIKTRALKGRGRAGRQQIATATTVAEQHMPERYYASFVELGARGVAGQEFFRKAFDVKEDEAARTFTRVLDKAIAFIWKSGGKLTGFRVTDGD